MRNLKIKLKLKGLPLKYFNQLKYAKQISNTTLTMSDIQNHSYISRANFISFIPKRDIPISLFAFIKSRQMRSTIVRHVRYRKLCLFRKSHDFMFELHKFCFSLSQKNYQEQITYFYLFFAKRIVNISFLSIFKTSDTYLFGF